MVEFTGERVVPGEVEVDLWNEHVARYAFAARFAQARRVLDAGCGTGYGSAELARVAQSVFGVDVSPEAVRYATEHYAARNVTFIQASCAALPVGDGSMDLVVAFEVIEHLEAWREFLAEARRVLSPGGRLLISTPNRLYYAESRRRYGPNPFHVHEFESEEFTGELRRLFPAVTLYLQNHVEAIGFQPRGADAGDPDLHRADTAAAPDESHFFIAVCSRDPQPPPRVFLYVPSTANILRERELHIERLEGELATKDGWLEEQRQEKQHLIEMFRQQTADLEQSNRWARQLDETVRAAQARIVQLQEELENSAAAYESKIAGLAEENRRSAEWALSLQREVEAKGKELVETVRLLDTAEKTVEERTEWALRLDVQLKELEAQVNLIRASRWLKLGRTLGLGPMVRSE